jgi:hypothetical protein
MRNWIKYKKQQATNSLAKARLTEFFTQRNFNSELLFGLKFLTSAFEYITNFCTFSIGSSGGRKKNFVPSPIYYPLQAMLSDHATSIGRSTAMAGFSVKFSNNLDAYHIAIS